MTKTQLYILEYLAVYGYLEVNNLKNLLRSNSYSRKVMASLINGKYVIKSNLKIKDETSDMRTKTIEKLTKVRSKLENMDTINGNKNLLKMTLYVLKKYSGADWDRTLDRTQKMTKIYKLSKNGKEVVRSLGYDVKTEISATNYINLRRAITKSNMAVNLTAPLLDCEVIPTMDNIRKSIQSKRPYFIPSQVAKKMTKSIGQRNRALGILCGPEVAHALYYDGNGQFNFNKQFVDNESNDTDKSKTPVTPKDRKQLKEALDDTYASDNYNLVKAKLFDGAPPIRDMIFYTTDSSLYLIIAEKILKVRSHLEYQNTHILEYNKSGLIATAILTYKPDWVRYCIELVLPRNQVSYDVSGRWKQADALWNDKAVFVMVTNEAARLSHLRDFTISDDKLKKVIIICQKSQADFYRDETQFPGATVMYLPEIGSQFI